jgi:hypothetical protein
MRQHNQTRRFNMISLRSDLDFETGQRGLVLVEHTCQLSCGAILGASPVKARTPRLTGYRAPTLVQAGAGFRADFPYACTANAGVRRDRRRFETLHFREPPPGKSLLA